MVIDILPIALAARFLARVSTGHSQPQATERGVPPSMKSTRAPQDLSLSVYRAKNSRKIVDKYEKPGFRTYFVFWVFYNMFIEIGLMGWI